MKLSSRLLRKAKNAGNTNSIDIRDIRELWRDGTIKGALHIPRGMLEFWLDPSSQYYNKDKFSKDKKIHFTYGEKFEKIITIINNCSFIVGNESGPACLGASMGKNVFSIYDPKHTPNLSSKIINKKIIYFK